MRFDNSGVRSMVVAYCPDDIDVACLNAMKAGTYAHASPTPLVSGLNTSACQGHIHQNLISPLRVLREGRWALGLQPCLARG